MFGSAFINAGRRVFNNTRRNISAASWSGDCYSNLIFGGDKIGVSDIGALFGAVGGAAVVSTEFIKCGETPLQKAAGGTAGALFGGIGGGIMGAIIVTPVFVSAISSVVVVGCGIAKLASNNQASSKDDSGKSR